MVNWFAAQQFDGIIYSFNTAVPDVIKAKASALGIKIKEYNIIYKLIDDLKEEINARLPLQDVEEEVGRATVLQEFMINVKNKKVPGNEKEF